MMLLPYFNKDLLEAGVDEAGRGCLAGPVVAAAVILPKSFRNDLLNDSKLLSAGQRDQLRLIIENEAIAFGIGIIDNRVIDQVNILRASFMAMHDAVRNLASTPRFLLIDGNRFDPYPDIPHECIVKGDGRYLSIAAASVLAKTYRDQIMFRLHRDFPMYGWQKNKGYPTKSHREALISHGVSPYHRMSFNLFGQPELF